MDFEAASLEALTISCEKSLKSKQLQVESRQKELDEMRRKCSELSVAIAQRLNAIFGDLTRS